MSGVEMLPGNPGPMAKLRHNETMLLQENPQFLDALLNNLPGMVYRCRNNHNWTMEYVSGGSKILTGYTPEDLVLDNVLPYAALIVAEDRERVRQEVQTALEQTRAYKTIYRINTRQGEQKWVWEQGGVAEDDSRVLQGVILDISKWKKTESALQESKDRFRNIVTGSIEGICVHYNGRVLFANQAMADILGYQSTDKILALGSIEEIFAPHERVRILGYIHARELGEAAPTRYEFEAQRRDGTIVTLEIVASMIHWEGQHAIQATFVDVTERKRALMEAEQQRQQLAHINRLNMLGEMAAGIAHEINQPLTAIASRCGAARRRIDGDNPDLDKVRIALEVIEQQAQRSGEIIQRMRGLAKRRNKKREISDIGALVQQCIEFAEMDGRIRDVTVNMNLSGNLPSIVGDPVQIQQVILNLINNATDVMEHLPVLERQITLSIKRHDESAVQVAVTDCGSGISDETEAKLFQSFFTTKESGMGMGLSISRSIIFAHGGSFWFTRNTERGVTFLFTLPTIL